MGEADRVEGDAISSALRGFFTNNLGYKLVALLLGGLLWFDTTTDETTVIEYPVPLLIAVEGRDMIVTNEVPSTVDVSFNGTGKELLRLDQDDLSITKEIAGGENDTTLVDLRVSDLQRPADFNVVPVGIAPGQVRVVTDRFVEKSVSLEPVGRPHVPDDHEIEDLSVEPRRVQIRGVTAEVGPIGSLALDLSQVEPDEGPFDERLQIAVPESLRTVTVNPDSVRISGRVVPRVEPTGTDGIEPPEPESD